MPFVAGVDSSTQSCTVVVRDAETGPDLIKRGLGHEAEAREAVLDRC
jgi:hypothetical protein